MITRKPPSSSRRGITLMEVLISIGILAIGLSSVVALVPAGKSQAAKAVVYDRAANLAMNVLNDALTFGFVRPASLHPFPASLPGTPPQLFVFDPLQFTTGTSVWANACMGALKTKGVYASGTDVCNPSSGSPELAIPVTALQSGDDLVYAAPPTDDTPPQNAFTAGMRSFQGRTSALLSVAKADGTVGAVAAGDLARVTAVVFHNRSLADPADAIVPGTYCGSSSTTAPPGTLAFSPPAGRRLNDVIRPGTVIYFPGAPAASPPIAPAWYQVALASPDEDDDYVYVTFTGDVEPPPPPGGSPPWTVYIALDSIGLAERVVPLEGPGPYGQ